jgi:site-specific recombinase XerD
MLELAVHQQPRRPPSHDARGYFAPRQGGDRPRTQPRDVTEAPFRLYLLTTGYSPETVRLRVTNLRLFARWASEYHVPLILASHEAVASYLAEQLAAVAQVTARSRLHALRSFFAFCRAQGWREDDPTAGIRIKLPHCQPKRPFTIEELRALLGVCVNNRDRAIVLVLAATGVRVSELLGMRPGDINWTDGTILIRGKGNRERRVALGGIALEALRGQVNGGGPIWRTVRGPTAGRPMTRVLVRDMLRALGKRANVGPVGSHRCRTTFANMFLREAGGDVGALQVLMGHQNIAQTLHYAGWTAADRALEQQRRMGFVDRLEA